MALEGTLFLESMFHTIDLILCQLMLLTLDDLNLTASLKFTLNLLENWPSAKVPPAEGLQGLSQRPARVTRKLALRVIRATPQTDLIPP
jgi:hypothetical protein